MDSVLISELQDSKFGVIHGFHQNGSQASLIVYRVPEQRELRTLMVFDGGDGEAAIYFDRDTPEKFQRMAITADERVSVELKNVAIITDEKIVSQFWAERIGRSGKEKGDIRERILEEIRKTGIPVPANDMERKLIWEIHNESRY